MTDDERAAMTRRFITTKSANEAWQKDYAKLASEVVRLSAELADKRSAIDNRDEAIKTLTAEVARLLGLVGELVAAGRRMRNRRPCSIDHVYLAWDAAAGRAATEATTRAASAPASASAPA